MSHTLQQVARSLALPLARALTIQKVFNLFFCALSKSSSRQPDQLGTSTLGTCGAKCDGRTPAGTTTKKPDKLFNLHTATNESERERAEKMVTSLCLTGSQARRRRQVRESARSRAPLDREAKRTSAGSLRKWPRDLQLASASFCAQVAGVIVAVFIIGHHQASSSAPGDSGACARRPRDRRCRQQQQQQQRGPAAGRRSLGEHRKVGGPRGSLLFWPPLAGTRRNSKQANNNNDRLAPLSTRTRLRSAENRSDVCSSGSGDLLLVRTGPLSRISLRKVNWPIGAVGAECISHAGHRCASSTRERNTGKH